VTAAATLLFGLSNFLGKTLGENLFVYKKVLPQAPSPKKLLHLVVFCMGIHKGIIALFGFCFFVFAACGRGYEGGASGSAEVLMPMDVVFVTGGAFFGTPQSNLFDTPIVVSDFYIGRFEVTQREWLEVMDENPSGFVNLDNPVERVSWYDAIVFLNRRSQMSGLTPFYVIDTENADPANYSETDEIRWTVTVNPGANGYRLPTEIEWEFAAGGGTLTRGYSFSGSDDATEVSWFFRNSGDEFLDGIWHWPTLEANNGRPHPVGQKSPNELGLYDMSGNVREWVWNWQSYEQLTPLSGENRSVRGGSWVAGEDASRIYFRAGMPPYFVTYELGFRVARNRVG
jgi:formylglycine-generating enzyme required for sulfatase activity